MTVAGFTTFGDGPFLMLIFLINVLSETGLPIGFVMTGIMVVAGYHLARGDVVGSADVVGAAAIGSLVGAMALYVFAQRLGMPTLLWVWRVLRLKPSWLESGHARSKSLTFLRITHGRIIPALSMPMTLAAGLGRVGLAPFLTAVLLSNVVWIAPFVVLGYVIASTGMDLGPAVSLAPIIIVVLALILLVAQIARPFWGRWRHRDATQIPDR